MPLPITKHHVVNANKYAPNGTRYPQLKHTRGLIPCAS